MLQLRNQPGRLGLTAATACLLATMITSAAESRSNASMQISKASFGKTPAGEETVVFTCTNANGLVARLTNYGARLVTMEVPDRPGKPANVNLGFDSLDKYLAHTAYFGCTVGRYANRVAKGNFTIDGKEFKLAMNDGANHLHGGIKAFDKLIWKAEELRTDNAVGVRFALRSPDGDEGYPGNLEVTVTYSLTNGNELRIDYLATTDQPTVVNLTNHAYWNLGGAGSGDVLGHKLTLTADHYLPVDSTLTPTGELVPVKGTAMDFTTPHAIGERIAETKRGVPPPGGYDHCYVLRSKTGELALAARVEEPNSGRVMEVFTTEPGVQLYTANFLDGGAANGGHKQHWAFCLETQHFPDSPNQPKFPSTILRPGQTFKSTTMHRFSVSK